PLVESLADALVAGERNHRRRLRGVRSTGYLAETDKPRCQGPTTSRCDKASSTFWQKSRNAAYSLGAMRLLLSASFLVMTTLLLSLETAISAEPKLLVTLAAVGKRRTLVPAGRRMVRSSSELVSAPTMTSFCREESEATDRTRSSELATGMLMPSPSRRAAAG